MEKFYTSDCESEDEVCTWSSILEETDQLICLNENTGNSLFSTAKAEARRSLKGKRDKAQPKFSIHFQTCKQETYSHNDVKDEDEESSMAMEGPSVQDIQNRISSHSMAELLEELQQENRKLGGSTSISANVVSLGNKGARYSVSTLLEDLEKNSSSRCPSKFVRRIKTKSRKAQVVGRLAASHLGNRSLNDEDASDSVGSRTSSEDEDIGKNNLIFATKSTKDQTMADIFQEVFSVSTMDAEEPPLATRTGIDYHGRLQQIMQKDKDRHMEFLKQLQSNDLRGINVKILSRFLDAKLTVCRCLLANKTTGSPTVNSTKKYEENGEITSRTIIFSSKICRDVELEVGNHVCIYPPWKEVQTSEDDITILCTYFSQIAS